MDNFTGFDWFIYSLGWLTLIYWIVKILAILLLGHDKEN